MPSASEIVEALASGDSIISSTLTAATLSILMQSGYLSPAEFDMARPIGSLDPVDQETSFKLAQLGFKELAMLEQFGISPSPLHSAMSRPVLTKPKQTVAPVAASTRRSFVPPPLSSALSSQSPIAQSPLASHFFSACSPSATSSGYIRFSPVAPRLSPGSLRIMTAGFEVPPLAIQPALKTETQAATGSTRPTMPCTEVYTEELDDGSRTPVLGLSETFPRCITGRVEVESVTSSDSGSNEDGLEFSGVLTQGGALLSPAKAPRRVI